MDSFESHEEEIPSTLDAVRSHVEALQQDLINQGVPLTGRVIHVCHYLPIVAKLNRVAGAPLTPPLTPPIGDTNVLPGSSGEDTRWTLSYRYGHDAMISGIKSICSTHDQVLVGWTGDISSSISPETNLDVSAISEEDKRAYQVALDGYEDEKERGRYRMKYQPVWLDGKVAHGHYDHYCKQILWPLFHYLLWQDVAHEYSSIDAGYLPYVSANLAYAQAVAKIWRPGDLVWVHDYHLLMVPKLLREEIGKIHFPSSSAPLPPLPDHHQKGGEDTAYFHHQPIPPPAHFHHSHGEHEGKSPESRENIPTLQGDIEAREVEINEDAIAIGLFVHTPFPSSEVFRCLPRRKEILEGMLGANLVAFQTYSYSRHFVSTCIRVCGYEMANSSALSTLSSTSNGDTGSAAHHPAYGAEQPRGVFGLDIDGHIVSVTHLSVGVDAERVGLDLLRPGIKPKLEALLTLYEGKKIIVGRDKLDVVKGVVQKLQAFQHLLTYYPQWRNQVVLIQVTSPALTDSPKLERQVSELVSHINGEFGSLDFIPVHHYHQTLKKDEFYALLSVADLALISPLRDGMNTTSMEFVVAQSRTKKSPSVLSEFMGISKDLSESLLVNPWNLGDVAAAINHGLRMPEDEKAKRHEKMYKAVMTKTSHMWGAELVRGMLGQMANSTRGRAKMTPYLPVEKLITKYRSVGEGGKRLFLFDYDGTLSPIVRQPHMAIPSQQTLHVLAELSQDPKNVVYIISGRDGVFLDLHLGHLDRVGFSAEHGGFVKEPLDPGKSDVEREWNNFTHNLDMSWMAEVEEIFRYYTERTTGSHVEMKKSSITWHYRGSDPEWGLFQCRQCQDLLENNLVNKRPIEVLVGKKNLEVRPVAVNKGEIVKRILYKNPEAEFIFCAGDDKTDEDMFRALSLFPQSRGSSRGANLGVDFISSIHSSPVSTASSQCPPISPLPLPPSALSPSPSLSSSMTLPPPSSHPKRRIVLPAPLSVTLVDDDAQNAPPVELSNLDADGIFTTAVGHSTKKTLAMWHVESPGEVVEAMMELVREIEGKD